MNEVLPPGMSMPHIAKGDRIVGFGHGSRSLYEVAWASNRPHDHRTPPVKVGDRVLYRSNDWMDPTEAVVVDILDEDGDPNLYRPDGSPHPDPWPSVILRIDPDKMPPSWDKRQRALARLAIRCQEARLEGSAGYLHRLWALYPQPKCGAGAM